MMRILVVNKARLMCDLMTTVLKNETDFTYIDYATTFEEALSRTESRTYDVALVNINLADNGALQLVRRLRKTNKTIKVLITGLVQSKAAVIHCIEEGAAGYIFEEESLSDLIAKIRAAVRSEFIVTPDIAAALMARLTALKRLSIQLSGFTQSKLQAQYAELTTREWEVLRLIEQGKTNQEIAEMLIIELGTVKNHVHNILHKLDVRRREHAVLFARQLSAEQRVRQNQKHSAPQQPTGWIWLTGVNLPASIGLQLE